jgi:hypothetical protein
VSDRDHHLVSSVFGRQSVNCPIWAWAACAQTAIAATDTHLETITTL